MIEGAEGADDLEQYLNDMLARGERIMGFGHRVYRAYDPRATVLKRTAMELGSPRVEVAAALEEAALKVLRERSPDRQLETNVEYWAAVVLDYAQIPPDLTPAMFGCARVAGLVGAHPRAEARSRASCAHRRATSVRRRARSPIFEHARRRGGRGRRARRGGEGARAVAAPRAVGRRARDRPRARPTSASAPSPTARSASSASARRRSCCVAGSRTTAPPCRGSALLSLERLSRDHPGDVNDVRPLLHELVDARRQRGRAPARRRRAPERLARAPTRSRSSRRSARTTSSRASCATRRRRSRRRSAARARSRARRSYRAAAGRRTGR